MRAPFRMGILMFDTWPGEGVCFGMPHDTYLRMGGLSFSSAKYALISGMDVWARSSLNPQPEEREQSLYTDLGAAYHARIIEGPEEFAARFAPTLRPEDYPDALVSADDLRSKLRELGAAKVGTRKADMAAALRSLGYEGPIWDELIAEYEAKHSGKTLLDQRLIDRIEYAAAMIERHPDLGPIFRGGFGEVAIFWRESQTGCPMKAKLDKLHLRAIADLKSFSNPQLRSLERAIPYIIAAKKYYLQAAIYIDAVRAARRMWREKTGLFVARAGAPHPTPEWLDRWASQPDDPSFVFVFQQTGTAPVTKGRRLPAGNIMSIGEIEYLTAARRVMEWHQRFGSDPWIDDEPIMDLDDSEFPAFVGM